MKESSRTTTDSSFVRHSFFTLHNLLEKETNESILYSKTKANEKIKRAGMEEGRVWVSTQKPGPS